MSFMNFNFKIFINKGRRIAQFCSVVIVVIMLFSSCVKNDTSLEPNLTAKQASTNKLGSIINLDPEKFQQLIINDPKVMLIDIRKTDELTGKYQMLKDAFHIEDNLIFNNPDTLPTDKSIVIMCKTGHRSEKLSEFLKNKGRVVYNLKGGLKKYYIWLYGDSSNNIEIPESEQDFKNESGC